MLEEPEKSDIVHLEWAIDQRAKIQHTLLKLSTFLADYDPDMMKTPWARTSALDDLIAAAFSLWRAAFLAGSLRDLENIQKAQRKFLERLITTNSITFTDDKNNDAWTFGYYLLAAMYRLVAAQNSVEGMLTPDDQATTQRLLRIHATGNPARNRYQWESLHAVLRFYLSRVTTGADDLVPEVPIPIPGDPFA